MLTKSYMLSYTYHETYSSRKGHESNAVNDTIHSNLAISQSRRYYKCEFTYTGTDHFIKTFIYNGSDENV